MADDQLSLGQPSDHDDDLTAPWRAEMAKGYAPLAAAIFRATPPALSGQTGPESDEVPALPWRQCKGCGGSGFWMTSTIFGQDEDVCDLCDGIGAVPDDDL